MFLAVAMTCVNDLTDVLLLLSLVFLVNQNLDFFNCFLVEQGERGRGMFMAILL